MAAMGLLYSTSFLHAGFLGLGALWLASYIGHGGYSGALHGGGGYGGGGGGGYGGGGGGGGGYGGDYGGGGGGYGAPYRRNDNPIGSTERRPWPDYSRPYAFRRRRRDVSTSPTEEEVMLSIIKNSDSDHCGLKLICELSSVRDRRLTRDERDILKFVRSGDPRYDWFRPGESVHSNSLVLVDYQKAAYYGRYYPDSCRQKYSGCRYSASDIMTMITSIKQSGVLTKPDH